MENLKAEFLLINNYDNDTIETPEMHLFDLIEEMYGDRSGYDLKTSYEMMLSAYTVYVFKDGNKVRLN